MKQISTFFAAALFAAFSLSAWAHGGEDHGSEAPQAPPVATAPGASAETEEFELVAALEGKKLTLTLDRFATNEPVADARVEVESGSALKSVASQVAPGVYALQVPDAVFAKPGKYPLTITVQAGQSADLLTATLDVAPPAPTSVAAAKAGNDWSVWSAAGALLLVGAGLVAVRRRNRSQ